MDGMTTPHTTSAVPLGDLAVPLGCTRACLYKAARRGEIGGVRRVGSAWRIIPAARDYHVRLGFGRGIPPYAEDGIKN